MLLHNITVYFQDPVTLVGVISVLTGHWHSCCLSCPHTVRFWGCAFTLMSYVSGVCFCHVCLPYVFAHACFCLFLCVMCSSVSLLFPDYGFICPTLLFPLLLSWFTSLLILPCCLCWLVFILPLVSLSVLV